MWFHIVKHMSTIKVLDKAFQILNSFDNANKSISLKDLTIITQLNKSTILRICNSLIKHNFLIKNEINGSYRLGPGSWKLGSIYNSNFKIGNEIKEILSQICEATGQSTGYWVKAGKKKVCLYRVNSKSELNHYVVEGTTFELSSATGKVLLAYTENHKELQVLIEKKGYIFTAGERLDNIASVAIPVFDKKGKFKGTISVSGWKQFFTNKTVPKYYKILSSYSNELKALLSNE